MIMLKRAFYLLAALTLAACGGGGGSPGTTGGTTTVTTPAAADVVLSLSASSIANSGSETIVATAIAIDNNRSTVTGVPVTLSVDSDAVVAQSTAKTDSTGQVQGTVSIGANRTPRTVRVTATSGSIVKTTVLQVQDTGGAATTASDLLLTLSSSSLANDGSQTVTANVTALDVKRNVLPGVVVSVSVDQGATIAPNGTNTSANGVLTAVIGTGGNSTNRVVTVTATAGSLIRTAQLNIVTAATNTAPQAADLNIALSSTALSNGGSSTVTATITAVNSSRVALANIPVAVSVDNNAVATVSGTTTNAQGVVTATIGIGADRSNRSITVTATSGIVTKSATFAVIGAVLTQSFAPQVTANSAGNEIAYRLVDANSVAMANQPISITSPSVPTVSGVTDSNGKFVYTYRAPTPVAPATTTSLSIVATAAGDTRTANILVTSASVPNATSVPLSASLTPTPSVVAVNSVGSDTNQVELRALFLGANNLPVPNVRVRFSVDPANSSDGTASQLGGGAFAYSNENGVARGTFVPGQRSSPTNGVTVRACWDITDFDATLPCPPNRLITATLTIAQEALSVSIRTNNQLQQGVNGLTYIKQFVVMVVDAAGQAKQDVLITPSVDLPAYFKGFYRWNGQAWTQVISLNSSEVYSWDASARTWVQTSNPTSPPMCPNEDANRNGVREAATYNASATTAPALSAREEDLNWNGDIDPRKADVAIKMVGSSRTDANGLAVVQIEYGKSVASWVDFVITVTASGVSGTESRARYSGLLYGVGNLPILAADISSELIAPPFRVSPYGTTNSCQNPN